MSEKKIGEIKREVLIVHDGKGNVEKVSTMGTVPLNPSYEIIDSYVPDPGLQPGEYIDENGKIAGQAVGG